MRKIVQGKGLVILLILMMLFAVAFNSSGALASPNPERVRVFINFTMTPGPAEEALVRSFGGTVRHVYQIVPALSAELPQSAISALQRNPKVTLIEPVIKAYLVDYQSELNNTWGVKRIEAGSVHVDDYFGSGVKVAIIDTGIDYNHTDLNADKNRGYDFADKNDDPMDVHSHGTHVAGTVAALRNGFGVVGAAPDAWLYALKVFKNDGSADYADIVAAIDWAVQNAIQITNNSYGSAANPGTTVQQAFDNAYYNHGVLHVAAAGNETTWPRYNQTNNVIYPAKFESVMAVSASDSNDKRANFSSNGPEVELIAPGVSINSTVLDGKYGAKSGTSMASPHVAGVAALVWAVNPSLTNVNVRNILKNTAEDLGLSANNQGSGLVRADLAVAAALGTDPPATYSLNLDVYPEGAGSVTGEGVYTEDEQVYITATANVGYIFVNWTEGSNLISNTANFIYPMPGRAVTLTANFEVEVEPPILKCDLTISSSAGGSVTLPGVGTFNYDDGTVVNLKAEPQEGYQFVKWTGDTANIADDNSAETTITMNGNHSITANFEEYTAPPSDEIVSVESISYTTSGGKNQDRHLHVTLALKDASGNAVSGASVSIELARNNSTVLTATGTTGTNGTVTFSYNNAPSGTYTTKVTAVTAEGLNWDGHDTPPGNTFTK